MAQNYWVTREKVDKYKFFVVEFTDRFGKQQVRQAGSGPFLSLRGAKDALDLINSKPDCSNAKILEFSGTWQDFEEKKIK